MKTLLGQTWFRALCALALMLVLGCIFNADGTFFKWQTHRGMLHFMSVIGILACGMTVVIITGGIDLAVGSVLGFCSVIFSIMSLHWGWPALAAIPACLAAGLVLGLVSGSLVAHLRIQPFIATLAMMVFARGLAKMVSGGQKISTYVKRDGEYVNVEMAPIFETLDSFLLGDNLPFAALLFLLSVALVWVILNKLKVGRYLYAIGDNEEASVLSGLPVRSVKLFAYALCGFFAALAGMIQAAQETQGDPEAGNTYELTAIAMVVIGGTSLMGGRGGVGLTLLGALTIGYLDKILSINGIQVATRLILTGVIIVLAVLFQRTRQQT